MDIDDYGDHAAVNCGPTHHHACACREAYFEERLAALQKTVDFERKMVANESAKLSATRDKLKEAARLATESAQLADGLAKELAAANEQCERSCAEVLDWREKAKAWVNAPGVEKLTADLAAANDRNAGWEKAAESWFASPEAAQRLEGYRELALKVNAAELALAAANERAGMLEVALNKLVTVTNGVTAPHRHNAPISMKHLDRLCEVQLDCERILGGSL